MVTLKMISKLLFRPTPAWSAARSLLVLTLPPSAPYPPMQIQPGTTVDSYYSQEQGVWHPDSLDMHLGWSGMGAPPQPPA